MKKLNYVRHNGGEFHMEDEFDPNQIGSRTFRRYISREEAEKLYPNDVKKFDEEYERNKGEIKMEPRYTISANDENVVVFGKISLNEARILLSLYEELEYDEIILGEEGSTLHIRKKNYRSDESSDSFGYDDKEKLEIENRFLSKSIQDSLDKRNALLDKYDLLINEVMDLTHDKIVAQDKVKELEELIKKMMPNEEEK
jgi:hypothetical protein